MQSHSRQENDYSSPSLKVLNSNFFDRPAEKVACDLIGCRLHWKIWDGFKGVADRRLAEIPPDECP
jgi:hypothetical protein